MHDLLKIAARLGLAIAAMTGLVAATGRPLTAAARSLPPTA